MKKQLFLSSIILSHILLSTGCTKTQPIEQIETTEITPIASTTPSTDSISSSSEDDSKNEVTTEQATPSATGSTHQLKSVQGESVTIIENGNVGFNFPQHKGKIVIFQIFGKDCEFCEKELPIINQIKSEYPNNIEVVSIQAQDRMNPSEKSHLINSHQIDYPIIEGNDAKPLLRFITKTYGWRGVLPYILILKDGATEYSFSDGGVSHEEFQESIKTLL